MHDIKAIRANPAAFDKDLARRGISPRAANLLALDDYRRARIRESQQAQAEGVPKDEIIKLKAAEKAASATLEEVLATIPNLPSADVPDGRGEQGNVEIRRVGSPPTFGFQPKEHFEIGEALGLMDFETAAILSGARFVVLKGALARMERALMQFMLDLHTGEHGYQEINPPLLVRDHVMFGTAQLPKFFADQFSVGQGHSKSWLIPTAEVPLTNLVRESVIDEKRLPLRYTAGTHCFRAEAGTAGRDSRGMIRQHQFEKVELVSITTPEQSAAEHERMVACAEEVLKRLGLHFRTVVLCADELGFASRKTYDIEVWLPGQRRFREISSCSVCGDFQARRMRAVGVSTCNGNKSTRFVHTLNGSGVAVGRALVAVLENYQEPDGSVTVPEVLRPYMGGIERITRQIGV